MREKRKDYRKEKERLKEKLINCVKKWGGGLMSKVRVLSVCVNVNEVICVFVWLNENVRVNVNVKERKKRYRRKIDR